MGVWVDVTMGAREIRLQLRLPERHESVLRSTRRSNESNLLFFHVESFLKYSREARVAKIMRLPYDLRFDKIRNYA